MLDMDTIEDRNKADSCARLVALVQTCWFACNTAARYFQELAITTLELTVIGFLAPTFATYPCWWHKPRDVMTTQTIQISVPLQAVLDHAGLSASAGWHHNPGDFVERSEFHGSVLYRSWINLLKHLAHPLWASKPSYIKIQQRRSDNDIIAFNDHWRYG